MKQKITISFVCFLLSISMFAQKGKDFILTMNQDTLYGKIKFSRKDKSVTFYHKKGKTKFRASTIGYFGLHERNKIKVYKIVRMFPREDVFVEVITEGKINLYYYDTRESKHYINGDKYRYFVSNSELEPIKISPRSYKNILKVFLKEQAALLDEVQDYEDVPRIIKKYNLSTSIELLKD